MGRIAQGASIAHMPALSPWTVVLTWTLLAMVQTSPQALGIMDWPSPLGGTFPGERVWYAILLGLFADFVFMRGGNRRWFAVAVACTALALVTAVLPRGIHQPAVFLLQLAVAAQLWAWASASRSHGIAGVALVQTAHACLIFPMVQMGYGPDLQSSTLSPLVASAGVLTDMAVTLAGTALVAAAMRRDLRQ